MERHRGSDGGLHVRSGPERHRGRVGGIGGPLARSEWNSVSSAWSHHAFYHCDGVVDVTALAVPRGGDIALAAHFSNNDLAEPLITLRGTGWLMLALGFLHAGGGWGRSITVRNGRRRRKAAVKRAGDLHPALLARQRLSTVHHSGRRA